MFWATCRLHALIELASVSSCQYLAIGAGDLMKLDCAGDSIALLVFNVNASHQLALIIFLPLALCTPLLPIEWLVVMRSSDWRIKVALDCLDFTLNYWSDNYCT